MKINKWKLGTTFLEDNQSCYHTTYIDMLDANGCIIHHHRILVHGNSKGEKSSRNLAKKIVKLLNASDIKAN